MAGLLGSQNPTTGILSSVPRVNSGLDALAAQVAALPVRPAAPVRQRVNPLRVIDHFLFDGEGIGAAIDQERLRPQTQAAAAAKLAAEAQARQSLLGMFGGGQAAGIQRTAETPAFTGAPMARAPGLPNIRDAAPVLAAAQLAGIEGVGGLRELITASQPNLQVAPDGTAFDSRDPRNAGRRFGKVENINGFLTDVNDPENVNRYLPDLQPGEEPVYDQRRNIIGVRNLSGAVESLAQRTRATNDASNASTASYAGAISGATAAGRAPYELATVEGPDGRPVTASLQSILGSGPIVGQSPAAAAAALVEAQGAANANVETRDRARAAPARIERYLSALDELPDATTGALAGPRLMGDRLGALVGLPGSQDRVAATETYRQLTGQDFGQLLRDTLGGAANFSNADREFLQQISAGNIELNRETLERVVNLNIRTQVDALKKAGGDYTIRVTSPQQAQRLPPGTRFTTPDGRVRVRQ